MGEVRKGVPDTPGRAAVHIKRLPCAVGSAGDPGSGERPGDPEVAELCRADGVEQDVAHLDVAVQDSSTVGVREAGGNREADRPASIIHTSCEYTTTWKLMASD